MGANSNNAYYLGVQIGIGRVLASVNSEGAWTSLDLAKQRARELIAAGVADDSAAKQLMAISRSSGLASLHDALVAITESFASMREPYGEVYYFGFWIGIAEAQASTGTTASRPHKEAALRKAQEYSSHLKGANYCLAPCEISYDFDHRILQVLREIWGERFRVHS